MDKETKLNGKRVEAERKKKTIEERKIKESMVINKKRKQSMKDQRKKQNKKNKVNGNSNSNNKKQIQMSNIKEIPNNCKHLVNDGDVLYVVPGDGCCGPNCGAAFLFHDEVFGSQLRRKNEQTNDKALECALQGYNTMFAWESF